MIFDGFNTIIKPFPCPTPIQPRLVHREQALMAAVAVATVAAAAAAATAAAAAAAVI